jgi:hypothetical protein
MMSTSETPDQVPGLQPGHNENEIPKKDRAIGPLADTSLDQESPQAPTESEESEPVEKPDKESGEWPTVSWP